MLRPLEAEMTPPAGAGAGPLFCACLCDVSWLAAGGVECSCFEGRFKGQIDDQGGSAGVETEVLDEYRVSR